MQPAGASAARDEKMVVGGNAKGQFRAMDERGGGVQKVRREEKLVVSRSAIARGREGGRVAKATARGKEGEIGAEGYES